MAFVVFAKIEGGTTRYLIGGMRFVRADLVTSENVLKFVYSPEYSESSIKQLIEWFRYQTPKNAFGSGKYGLIRISENSNGLHLGKEMVITFRFKKPGLLGQKRYGKVWA